MADHRFNYSDTFGTLSTCACQDCMSIYSPAAYLTDILMFLKPAQRAGLLQAARRPDLGEIQLSCANTKTPLPYIDLVNEVLEYAVAVPPADPPTAPVPGWPQSVGTAADLAVNPEHLDEEAYGKLQGEIYSWRLPFDLWAEEARIYLEKLGLPRATLMEVFQDQRTAPAVDIAAESLRLTATERRLITARLSVKPVRAATLAPLAQLSALQTVDGVVLADGDRVLVKDQGIGGDPANGVYVVRANAWERAPDAGVSTLHDGALVPVSEGTQQGTRWVLTTKEPFIVGQDPLTFAGFTRAGDPDTLEYDPLRVWYATGDPNAAADLPRLKSQVGHFLARAGLEYQELLDLLHTRYVNPAAVLAEVITIQFPNDDCNLNTATFNPVLTDAALSRIHRFVRLQRKLGWTSAELDRAITAFGAPDLTDRFLVQLATLRRIRGKDGPPLLEMLAWWGGLDTSLDADDSPSFYERTFQNQAVLSVEGASAFALDAQRKDLLPAPDIIAAHKPGLIAALGISTDDLELLLARRRRNAPLQPLNLVNLSWLFRHVSLARLLDRPIPEVLSLLDLSGIDPFDREKTEEALRFIEVSRQVAVSGFRIVELDYLLRDIARVADGVAPSGEFVDLTLREIQTGLRKIPADAAAAVAEGFVVQKLAPALQLESAVTAALLRQGLLSPAGGRSAMAELLDPAFVGSDPPSAIGIKTLQRIWKAALVLRRLRINTERFGLVEQPAWLCTRGPAIGWLDLNTLPLTGGTGVANPDPALLEGWRRLVDFFTVWDGLRRGLPSLFSILDLARTAAPQVDFITALASRSAWKAEDLSALTGPNGLGLIYPADYKDERCLVRLAACARVMRKLRVSAAQLLDWRTLPADRNTAVRVAREIRQATKARLDDAAWRQQAKPMQDLLRGWRRDALVAYLVSQRGFADTNALFEWFLLDVETTPVVLTSRIKQSIGTVQLFIQRSIMNLESGVAIAAADAEHWLTWMKSEQLWEANRKVFLYPENWLDERLLPDKTPLFAELENRLLQREVTAESAEDAFRGYLEGLDQIARLEVVGVYHDVPTDGGHEVLHVFGRTLNQPPVHFYRTYTLESNSEGLWSPWHKVDLDIQGGHLIPVMFNRRLHLFWPVFTEKSDNVKGQTTSTHYEIQLAWSENKGGRWTAKRLSAPISGPELPWLYLQRPVQSTAADRFHGSENASGLEIVMEQDFVGEFENTLNRATFVFASCGGAPTATAVGIANVSIPTPPDTEVEYQQFRSEGPAKGLSFTLNDDTSVPVLGHVPSPFRVLVPHQYLVFRGSDSFFYQDQRRIFFARFLGTTTNYGISDGKVNLAAINAVRASFPYSAATSTVVPPPPDPAAFRTTRVDPESVPLRTLTNFAGGGV